eukprot:13510859-Alexandrium_andersonii.AAC.1
MMIPPLVSTSRANSWTSSSHCVRFSERSYTALPCPSRRTRGAGRHRPSRACWAAIPRENGRAKRWRVQSTGREILPG